METLLLSKSTFLLFGFNLAHTMLSQILTDSTLSQQPKPKSHCLTVKLTHVPGSVCRVCLLFFLFLAAVILSFTIQPLWPQPHIVCDHRDELLSCPLRTSLSTGESNSHWVVSVCTAVLFESCTIQPYWQLSRFTLEVCPAVYRGEFSFAL